MQIDPSVRDGVRTYYGQVLQRSGDLRTSACCSPAAVEPHVRDALSRVDDEVLARFYGCGSPIPPAIQGCTVLDLGCGSGRDVYVAAQLVGPEGRVVGLDMTEEQLAVARRAEAPHMERFGYASSNVDFRHGYIEDLAGAGIADASVDVVISNCVINLSPDKRRVFEEILRVLKPGGELYFSDVFADRRVPAELTADPVLYGECLGGAMYTEDFRRLLVDLGCPDYRVVARSPIEVEDEALAAKLGALSFESLTIRAFRLETLEDQCEDYGQVAWYAGTIPHAPHYFDLDDHHRFERGRGVTVCGNTASMLQETRLAEHFRVAGDRSVHFGLFDCAPVLEADPGASGSCC